VGIAHDDRHVGAVGSQAHELRGALVAEVVAQPQVLGGVAGERHLGADNELGGPAARAASTGLALIFSALPGKSPTWTSDLGDGDFHGSFYQVGEELRILESLSDAVDPARWDALAGPQPTVISTRSWTGLHASGCASEKNGWAPRYHHALGGRSAPRAPCRLYVKSHSRGEYVSTGPGPDAYEAGHGIEYYPKLLAAVPLHVTPARARGCSRRATRSACASRARSRDRARIRRLVAARALPAEDDARGAARGGHARARGVQFHWRNAGYATFDGFLGALSHDKRKKIRQERRRVAEAGVSLRRVTGREASGADWDFFTQCYRRTYREHRSTPYLTASSSACSPSACPTTCCW
jgi:predicted N-acyltransferase